MSAQSLVASLCPDPLTGVADEQLGDVIDAWLADEFASADHDSNLDTSEEENSEPEIDDEEACRCEGCGECEVCLEDERERWSMLWSYWGDLL